MLAATTVVRIDYFAVSLGTFQPTMTVMVGTWRAVLHGIGKRPSGATSYDRPTYNGLGSPGLHGVNNTMGVLVSMASTPRTATRMSWFEGLR
jgi:hypothetical protein